MIDSRVTMLTLAVLRERRETVTVRVQRCNGEKGEETTTLSYELSRHSMDNRLPSTVPTHMSSFLTVMGRNEKKK